MEFTSWDAGLRPCELEHHGIPGMKWGVRRFQNSDGSLTAAGEKRYGSGSITNRQGARSMTRHLNKLDKGYANVAARARADQYRTAKYSRKMNKARAKGNEAKAEKYQKKAMKAATKAAQAQKNKKAIENLQWRIMAKAARKGYTTNSSAVTRNASDAKTKVATILGGPVAGMVYSARMKGRNVTPVSGQKFKVKRWGDGSTNVVNYNNAANISREQAELERRRRLAAAMR